MLGRVNKLTTLSKGRIVTKLFRSVLFLSIIIPFFQAANAFSMETAEQTFLKSQQAYQSKNIELLEQKIKLLKAQNYVLLPYAEYWLLLLKMHNLDQAQVQSFRSKYFETRFAEKVTAEWLKVLAKRDDWSGFFELLSEYKGEDVGIACHAIEGRFKQGDINILNNGKTYWELNTNKPESCERVFNMMQSASVLNEDDIVLKFRSALQDEQTSLAKNILSRMPDYSSSIQNQFEAAIKSPQSYLETKVNQNFETRISRELYIYAINRYLRIKPEVAKDTWEKVAQQFTENEVNYMWRNFAVYAARRHDAEAINIYGRVKLPMDHEAHAWKVRAAMWANNWDVVLTSLNEMSIEQQAEPVWRYWKARAYKAKRDIPKANKILIELMKERNFYGLLAEDEIGEILTTATNVYNPTELEVQNIASLPSIQRSLTLQQLGLKWDSKLEWAWAIKSLDDKQLLAAAEFALRNNWYDLAISTAEKTKHTHNFALRFPTPYRETVSNYAQLHGVDEAWVYGLTRQESRFNTSANSGVGAAGLMQVMPATAAWIAKRMGFENYKQDKLHQIDTNVHLGTYYLKYTLNLAQGQVPVATAAYNAGPGRVKAWTANQPIEGAIYVENIPILETRLYVQKVMANTHFYAQLLGAKTQGIKQSLGLVGDLKPAAADE
jgi:soluble lytic murein transglycosylase